MKILIAEDDPTTQRLLEARLARLHYETVSTADGVEAWACLEHDREIEVAILDWEMPEIDGIQLCRRIRGELTERRVYVLLCTCRTRPEEVAQGLDAGADDYLRKPVDPAELGARLRVGERTLALEKSLQKRIVDLDEALEHVQQLQGLLPICMHCKRIRDTNDTWQRIEQYVAERADVSFSHGICEACLNEHYPESAAEQARKNRRR